ncbi:MAG: F0F1 ATP synthase subunit A [Chloroflexi bacterium]|nr:F0F1 ATP synthase subunit A [Chloroflexota bacterium]
MSKLIKWVVFIAVIVGLCSLASALGKLGNFPAVALPAEAPFSIGGFPVANTLITTILADAVLLLFVFAAMRKIRRGDPDAEIPRGAQNIFELMMDALYGLCKNVAGSNALKIFPVMATIFLFVLFANWMEMVPGMESIGTLHAPHEGTGFKPVELIAGTLYTVDRAQPVALEAHATEGEAQPVEGEPASEMCTSCIVVPFFRVPTSDINTTLALSLVTMVLVQVFGVRALGGAYFYKFINIPALKKGGMGIMFFVVGFLELVSEISRILSFAFRLLGNIFAGGVLLFVMTSLMPFILPVPFYGLELFVGFIQALVFSMLSLAFISAAMTSHDGHEEAHH